MTVRIRKKKLDNSNPNRRRWLVGRDIWLPVDVLLVVWVILRAASCLAKLSRPDKTKKSPADDFNEELSPTFHSTTTTCWANT